MKTVDRCDCGEIRVIMFEDEQPDFDFAGWLEFEQDNKITLWNHNEVACEHGCCIKNTCVGCDKVISTQRKFDVVGVADEQRCACFNGTQPVCKFDIRPEFAQKLIKEPNEVLRVGQRELG